MYYKEKSAKVVYNTFIIRKKLRGERNEKNNEEKKNAIIAKAKELTENVKSFKSVSAKMKAVDLNENYLTLQEIGLAFKETNNLINKNTSLINTFYSDIKKEKENFVKSIKR